MAVKKKSTHRSVYSKALNEGAKKKLVKNNGRIPSKKNKDSKVKKLIKLAKSKKSKKKSKVKKK